MWKSTITLTAVLLVPLASTAWADPGKDESGKGRYQDYSHYEDYRESEREARKRDWEHRREAAKARREYERETARFWAEMEREERKHYEEMRREALKHDEEVWRDGYVEIDTVIHIPW